MPALAATGPIMGHVRAIQAAHRKLTGRDLDFPTAINLLDRYNATLDDDDMPPKVFEVQIGCFLVQESYSPEAIRRVLKHCATYRTAAYCEDLDAADVEAVDVLLAGR